MIKIEVETCQQRWGDECGCQLSVQDSFDLNCFYTVELTTDQARSLYEKLKKEFE